MPEIYYHDKVGATTKKGGISHGHQGVDEKKSVSEDKVDALRELLEKLRLHAMGQPGYVSGETLKRIDAPGIRLVISKWKSLREWRLWYDTPDRKAFQDQIDALAGGKPRSMKCMITNRPERKTRLFV